MATVVLQTLGAAVGGAVGGPIGAMVGRAAGALAGSAIDQKLFSKDQVIEGPRLDSANVLTSTDGAPIPKVYGRNRISGQIIWATRFEESSSTSGGGGGKGTQPSSPSTRTYSYSTNFAVGICEGPISGIRRMWADGEELDLSRIEYRIYTGVEDQMPDPLIEAKQGTGNTPAYRGIAYVVFESFALGGYGNRIPQLTFEVMRSIGKLERDVKSITMIPGSTEYGYDIAPISIGGQGLPFVSHNTHSNLAKTDWIASLDELLMLCPNLESVTLVVAWFGTDLRAGHCQIKPGITTFFGPDWNVAGLSRLYGYEVSKVNGRGAYGGTPSDASVYRAIADLKSRGLKVVIYPFIMMDIPIENQLPWRDGQTAQPSYPWRGEITCISGDQTASARSQINAFMGNGSDFRYRRMILHYANIAKSSGVDGFLIGSEMRGLTRIRDGNDAFPFVDALVSLAYSVKSWLGNDCFVSYAADWSEYFGYHPQDGSSDVFYHLDPLWASSHIDAIAIDNYMPLSDWRDEGDPGVNDAKSPFDLEYLKSNISGGEGYDWYYASADDRQNAIRTPITDGLGEPWTFRYKDLHSWWSNNHFDRVAGVKKQTSTAWQPQSKPIYFTELGCPAIDKGANQPNVFYDPKSAQSALPYFSSGGRDDLIQRRFLQAHLEYWSDPVNNPISSAYNAPMVDASKIAPWAWDARPFPWFPLDEDTWSDGTNWYTGHWLNGRFGSFAIDDLIREILKDYGEENYVLEADGYLDGYVIPTQASLRTTLEPLIKLFDIQVFELDGIIHFKQHAYASRISVEFDNLVQEEDEPKRITSRNAELELPSEVVINHQSLFGLYEVAGTKSRRIEGGSDRQISINLPAVMSENIALDLANKQLRQAWVGRDECKVSLPTSYLAVTIGDVITMSDMPQKHWLVEGMDTGVTQDLTLRAIHDFPLVSSNHGRQKIAFESKIVFGQPQTLLMDLPLIHAADVTKYQSHMVVTAQPWASGYGVYASPADDGYVYKDRLSQRGVVGTLLAPLSSGPLGRWDRANEISVSLSNGQFQSAERLGVLNGANMALVQAQNGHFEILQFTNAILQEDGSWKLSKLLRGQLGTEPEMLSGAQAGASIILFNEAVVPIELEASQVSLEHNWLVGPASDVISADTYTKIKHTNNSRSRRMLRPVHLKAEEKQGGIHFSWIRQGRIDADSWEGADIPLDANQEQYQIRIFDTQDNLKRELTTQTAAFIYETAQQITDLGSASTDFIIELAQLGDTGLAGDVVRHSHTV